MHKQIKQIKKCPLCKSIQRELKFTSIRDGIPSYIYKCKKCDLVYNGIMLQNKNSSLLDDKFSEGKKEINEFNRWERLQNHKLFKIEQFIKKSPKKETLRILEIGCGPGALLSAAKKRGWKEYGIEPFVKSYTLAKDKGLNVHNGFLKDKNYPDNYFDLIISIEVVEHFEDQVNEFKEISRVLKEDGLIVIQTANIDGIKFKIKKSKSPYLYYDHLCYFSPKTLTKILDKFNLNIVKSFPDEINLKNRLIWCKTFYSKFRWVIFYIIRAIFLNKPILGSMTLYIQHKNILKLNKFEKEELL